MFFSDDNSETRFSDEGYFHSAQGRNAVNVAAQCSFFRRLCCADRIPWHHVEIWQKEKITACLNGQWTFWYFMFLYLTSACTLDLSSVSAMGVALNLSDCIFFFFIVHVLVFCDCLNTFTSPPYDFLVTDASDVPPKGVRDLWLGWARQYL